MAQPFSFEMLGVELDKFFSSLGTHASEYLNAANVSTGEVKTLLKNVVPRITGDFPVDLAENETSFIITCEITGVEKQNLSIKLLNPTTVLIKAEIEEPESKEDEEIGIKENAESDAPDTEMKTEGDSDTKSSSIPTNEETYHLHELKNKTRQRTIILPAKVTSTGAHATFKNGIVEITLAKEEPDSGMTIDIE